MSQLSHLSARNCLEWSIENICCHRSRKSPAFSYLGNEWCLELSEHISYGETSYYKLYLRTVDSSKVIHNLTKITVFMYSSRQETCNYLGSFNLKKGSYKTIVDRIVISRYDLNRPWLIYCIFSTDLPSKLHIKENKTKHLISNLTAQSNIPGYSSIVVRNAKSPASVADYYLADDEILSTDFGKLLEQESTSDVTLKCGDRTFSAHRLILAARSEVFAAMFRAKMIESETGSIDIKDIDVEVFELLLKYVYSGKISDLSVDIACKLYIAADKYSIQSLKNNCSKWMLGSLTEENCLDFLVIADTWDDEILKDGLVHFVAEILHLLKGDEWQKFSDEHPKLALTVYQTRVFTKPV